MRYSEEEPAIVVLERLRAAKPQPTAPPPPDALHRPGIDLTYPDRLKAWELAVAREEKRAVEEAAGTYQPPPPPPEADPPPPLLDMTPGGPLVTKSGKLRKRRA